MGRDLCLATVMALAGAIGASPALAQEWSIGAGWSDFNSAKGRDTGAVTFDYHAAPFYDGTRTRAGWALAGSLTGQGDVFIGAGVALTYDVSPAWFLEAGVTPGVYFDSVKPNDLGSNFEIRSLVGLGYRFGTGSSVSLAVTHKSNAGASNVNPGVNSIFLRWHREL